MTLNLKSEFSKVFALIPNPSEPKSKIFLPFHLCCVKSFLALISNALTQKSLVFKNFNVVLILATLNIFITGDSGPMHIAASLQIPTISLFGPTNSIETSQWKNPNSMILKKNLDCQPCMKKKCPLDHHNCMKLIEADQVIDSISKVIKI